MKIQISWDNVPSNEIFICKMVSKHSLGRKLQDLYIVFDCLHSKDQANKLNI